MILKKDDLLKCLGGSNTLAVAALVGGVITFLIGFFDGLTRPYKCR